MFTISGFYKFKKINSLKKYKAYLENEISNTDRSEKRTGGRIN